MTHCSHSRRKPNPAAAIRELREMASLSIEETAARAGTAPRYLEAVECGDVGEPTHAFVARVVEAIADELISSGTSRPRRLRRPYEATEHLAGYDG